MIARLKNALGGARIGAARRVIQRFHRRRLTVTRRNVAIHDQGRDTPIVTIDRLNVSEGRIRIQGHADASSISFATERAFKSVALDPMTRKFDIEIDGAIQLTLSVNGEPTRHEVKLQSGLQSFGGQLVSGLALAAVLKSYRDIWGYLVNGDSEAGDRLEALIDPPAAAELVPIAMPGLFSNTTKRVPGDLSVDIILPVYNAYEDTRRCLENLGRHTDGQHRFLVVEDGSTDPRIRPLVTAWVTEHPNAELIANTENLGFIGAVNLGLARAEGHVVLLNSDAFVPDGWLERLIAPILTDPQVASVTPMSSDAEIMTAPVECSRVELNDGQADIIDRVAQRLSPGAAWAELPTGVGFCMALARGWLEQVPEFDHAFGRGYGEEVDWCRRVAEKGGRHIGIGTLYVEHRGGSSFGEEKLARVRANARLIEARYPGYDQLVADFRREDPLIGPRIALAIASISGKHRVPVYIAQRMGGGSEAWLDREIVNDLSTGAGAVVVRDGPSEGTVIIEVHAPTGVTSGAVPFDEVGSYLRSAKHLKIKYSGLVSARAPLQLLQTLLIGLNEEDDLVVYFHDYFPVCPSYNLMSHEGVFCDLPEPSTCQACYAKLPQTSGRRPANISEWRAEWGQVIEQASSFVTFSENSASILRRVWPEHSDRLVVEPHALIGRTSEIPVDPSKPPVLGVLGSIGYNKGAGVLQGLADNAGGRFRIVVIGNLDPAFRHKGIDVHGAYDQADIENLAELYGVSHWFVPSIWPETFCFAAHECLATGLPVLSFDIGAHGDAVGTHPRGTLVALDTPPHVLAEDVYDWLTSSAPPSQKSGHQTR